MQSKTKKRGFTLLEILLVIALIAILAAIVIVAINPNKQLGEGRNAQRRADVNTILNAVYQYTIDNNGTLPSSITTTETEICDSAIGEEDCNSYPYVYLAVLFTDEKYLVSLPNDPLTHGPDGTGYKIKKDTHNRVTVNAPHAEQGATISVTR